MNTYLFAYYYHRNVFFKEIPAKSFADFKDKFVRWAFDKWDFVENEDYDELINELNSNKVYISEVREQD